MDSLQSWPVAVNPHRRRSCRCEGRVLSDGLDPLSGRVVRQRDDTYSGCGNRQTLTPPSDSVLRQTRTARARFLSDTAHYPMATFIVYPTTVPDSESGPWPSELVIQFRGVWGSTPTRSSGFAFFFFFRVFVVMVVLAVVVILRFAALSLR